LRRKKKERKGKLEKYTKEEVNKTERQGEIKK
jgi:hypothetical protein